MAMQEAAQAAASAAANVRDDSLWNKMARGLETEAELHNFFARRQWAAQGGGPQLHIASAVKVVNNERLRAFASAHAFNVNAIKAYHQGDSFLFHGCPQQAATNVQADGLQMTFASPGMLGKGLYGAPDPRKSLQFCKNSQDGRFMFVCRFNLRHAKRAGPNTHHRNTIFDEFCVYDDRHVVVLWMIKLA